MFQNLYDEIFIITVINILKSIGILNEHTQVIAQSIALNIYSLRIHKTIMQLVNQQY